MLVPTTLKTFFYLPIVDFRKSVDGLSMLVAETMRLPLGDDKIFIFRNKKGDRIKALHYSHHCFSLIYCRLDKGKWIFPRGESGHLELTQEHVRWILSSHRYSKIEALNAENYSAFI
jgi:transposase